MGIYLNPDNKIAQHLSFEKHLNKYNVIHLNIPNFLEDAEDASDLIKFIKEIFLMNCSAHSPMCRCPSESR